MGRSAYLAIACSLCLSVGAQGQARAVTSSKTQAVDSYRLLVAADTQNSAGGPAFNGASAAASNSAGTATNVTGASASFGGTFGGAAGTASSSTQVNSAPLRPAIPNGLLSQPAPQPGLLSQSQSKSEGHEPGIIARALGGVVSDAAHATMALVGTPILNQGHDLPPDDASAPEWPFNEPHRKALFTVDWADGSTARISRLPDGSLQILGGGRRYTMQPEGEGSYALFGDYGSMATVTPRPGGGFTIVKADGSIEQVLPRDGGGFVVEGRNGVMATILPGVGGKKHVIRGHGLLSSGFIQ